MKRHGTREYKTENRQSHKPTEKRETARAIAAEKPKDITGAKSRKGECLTALPPTIDVAALADLYNSPPTSNIAHEYLREQARRAMMKYELAQADLEIAADSLAHTMHFLIEQHGVEHLPPEQMAELERDVLEWYGLCGQAGDLPSLNDSKKEARSTTAFTTSTAHKNSPAGKPAPAASTHLHATPKPHGTAIAH